MAKLNLADLKGNKEIIVTDNEGHSIFLEDLVLTNWILEKYVPELSPFPDVTDLREQIAKEIEALEGYDFMNLRKTLIDRDAVLNLVRGKRWSDE